MGYMVKDSLAAAPRQYTLERIQFERAQMLLAGNAMVREERQDFWYCVGELLGESPSKEIQFSCPHCRDTTRAREIDVRLEVRCKNCEKIILVPDTLPQNETAADRHLLRRGNQLLCWGATIFLGMRALAASGHGIYVVTPAVDIVGICMMINGYGKRRLYHLNHSSGAPFSVPPTAS